MGFMLAFEWILVLAAAGFFVHQVIGPALSGRPLLPLFRRRSWTDRQLRAAQQKEAAAATRLSVEEALDRAERVEEKAARLEEERVNRIMKEEV